MLGIVSFFGGISFGLFHWYRAFISGVSTPSGTIVLAALPIVLGFQLLLAALSYDVSNVPFRPLLKQVLSPQKGKPVQNFPAHCQNED